MATGTACMAVLKSNVVYCSLLAQTDSSNAMRDSESEDNMTARAYSRPTPALQFLDNSKI